ncbi:MAG TPA: hypothetical protein VHC43_00900 [Mycobacteriales bacterium]|nr:hypothetical protein [Mycobacteriales bacterium]
MTPRDIDDLTETFSVHEMQAPDADEVLAKSSQIAQHMRRRQWAVRTTGTVAVTAAVVAGAVALPGLLRGNPPHNTAVIQPASGSGPAAQHTQDQEFTAFFNAGYVYGDAQKLARLWHENGDIGSVKAEAGGRLLDGETLPVAPSGTPATADDLAYQAFFNAGYTYDDAVKLGQAWHETDISQIKIEAGKKLENGETLPVAPSGKEAPTSPQAQADASAAQAFFDAGYTYDDAVRLAQMWNTTDTYHAKVEGGQKLENGESLPVPPSGTPASDDQQAIDAYFAAGYNYDDAVQLGKMWHETDISQVKVEAGKKLENGESLPIAP